jgi:hypothetical protein
MTVNFGGFLYAVQRFGFAHTLFYNSFGRIALHLYYLNVLWEQVLSLR